LRNPNITIAKNLKSLRQKKEWSLDETSKRTGVSKAMLGQIERGESSPTVATLWKIANGFKASFSHFTESEISNKKTVIRAQKDFAKIHSKDNKIKVTSIFPYDKKLGLEIFSIELKPGSEHLSLPHHGSVIEHVIPIDGAIEIFVDNAWRKIKKGEGLRFNADKAHGYRNHSNTTVTFHNVIHYFPL
jgi:transcriptional regulator with XRE-family HTH domain